MYGERESLHSPGCPRTHYVDQAGLKFTETHLPLLGLIPHLALIFFKIYFYLFKCVCGVYQCVLCVYEFPQSPKKASDPLELETVVSHHVGAGNQTPVLCQSRAADTLNC